MKFVDLQGPALCRPTSDLAYLIYLNTTPELRKSKLQDILQKYYETLTENLEHYGYKDVYTFEKFKKDFEECFCVGLMMGLINVQVITILSVDSSC